MTKVNNLTAIILSAKDTDPIKLKRAVKSVEFAGEVMITKQERPVEDFSAARNKALKKAKGRWVLFVDSDEEVSPDLALEVKQVLGNTSSETQNIKGYCLRRKDRFLGRWLNHGETGRVRLVRLSRKDAGRWERPVHEVWQIKGRVGMLRSPLLHYAHDSVGELVEKIDRYSTLDQKYQGHHQRQKYQNFYHPVIFIKMLMLPMGKFVSNYIFRLGFLDGVPGLIQAGMMSWHSFLVRAKQLEKRRRRAR